MARTLNEKCVKERITNNTAIMKSTKKSIGIDLSNMVKGQFKVEPRVLRLELSRFIKAALAVYEDIEKLKLTKEPK